MPYRSQKWLIQRMEQLIPNTNATGVCFGITAMKIQAILSETSLIFETRLQLINEIPVEHFISEVNRLQKKRIELIKQVKEEIGPFRELSFDEQADFLKSSEVHTELLKILHGVQALVKENRLQSEDISKELRKRKDSYFFNAFVQKKIEQKLSSFSETDKIKLDIPVFLEGIQIHQQLESYPDLLPSNYSIGQNVQTSVPLAASKLIEQQGGIYSQGFFTGVYEYDDLIQYFTSFADAANTLKSTAPIAILLCNQIHALCVEYNKSQGLWFFTDPNQLPTIAYKDSKSIALAAHIALTTTRVAVLMTEIFSRQVDKKECAAVVDLWKKKDSWKKIHAPTLEKAKKRDFLNMSWRNYAIAVGDFAVAKELVLLTGSRGALGEEGEYSPLFLAVAYKQLKILRFLLAKGSCPNIKNVKDGMMVLNAAVLSGQLDFARCLLDAGACPNFQDDSQQTVLHIAVKRGDLKMTELLLLYNAMSMPMVDGYTPLYFAVQNNNIQLVKLLLQSQMKYTDCVYANLDIIRFFASSHGKKDALESFLAEKTSENRLDAYLGTGLKKDHITLTCEEFAQIMGFQELVAGLVNTNLDSGCKKENRSIFSSDLTISSKDISEGYIMDDIFMKA